MSAVDDPFETLDLSQYKTAHGAAKAAGRKLKAIAESVGHNPDVEVVVDKRDDRHGERWLVAYDAGEWDWAVRMTGGTPVYGVDEPVLTGFYNNDGWSIECDHGNALAFYPQ